MASISGAIHNQWANPIRAHCIDTHLAGDEGFGVKLEGFTGWRSMPLAEYNLCILSDEMDDGNRFAC